MVLLESIEKRFAERGGGPLRVLEDVSLTVRAGEFVAIQGTSGSGKTTLLLVAGGLLRPDGGRVVVGGQDPYALTPEARCRFRATTIGFVFQQFHLLPYLDVLGNILAAALAGAGGEASVLRARALELATRFGLADRLHHRPAELSTGERQRVALARALFNRPTVLMADEPTGNLDPQNGELVLEALRDFAAAGGAVLLVTHEARAAARAQRVVRLASGRVV